MILERLVPLQLLRLLLDLGSEAKVRVFMGLGHLGDFMVLLLVHVLKHGVFGGFVIESVMNIVGDCGKHGLLLGLQLLIQDLPRLLVDLGLSLDVLLKLHQLQLLLQVDLDFPLLFLLHLVLQELLHVPLLHLVLIGTLGPLRILVGKESAFFPVLDVLLFLEHLYLHSLFLFELICSLAEILEGIGLGLSLLIESPA